VSDQPPSIASSGQFVRWFRGASPYINAHRQKTFVILFGGDAVANGGFAELIHDIALLGALGIRLVLVHGTRPQVAERLIANGETPRYQDGLRITSPAAMVCVKEAAGTVRTDIESLLSMGVANSPMAGARLRVVSGNFVTARPIGIKDGTDFGHTGHVRRIDGNAIHAQLDLGSVVLLSPIGYSPTGESFNLSAQEVARETAIALGADKLLVLGEAHGLTDPNGHLMRELSRVQAQAWVDRQPEDSTQRQTVSDALQALGGGVQRAHILDRHTPGVLLLELFTRDGIGTLITADRFEETRTARIDDVGGILELIAPLEAASALVRRSRERLETDIGDFSVMERDGMVVACAACHRYPAEQIAELACLAVHPDYTRSGRGAALLTRAERDLAANGIKRLFVLTTQTAHWFLERGFKPSTLSDLPVARQSMVNYRRSAQVYSKDI
jgi:amino-acid N-acetyltransferase